MDDTEPHGSAGEQLDAIARLGGILEGRGIDHWLFGGWAVDFWVGRVTRPHHDVDVAAWQSDYDAIAEVLTAEGWRHTPAEDEVVGTCYWWDDALVEFTFVVAGDDGRVLIPFEPEPAVWCERPLGNDRRELDGVRCRTIPLSVLRAGKETPRTESADAAKDLADFRVLAGVEGTID